MKTSHAIGAAILVGFLSGSVLSAGKPVPEAQPVRPERPSVYVMMTITEAAQEPFKAMRGLYTGASKGVIKVIGQPRLGRPIFGSGFFVSSSGLIATNWHVIASPSLSAVAIQIEDVILGVSVLAIDEKADVAILKPTEAMSIPCVLSGRIAADPAVGSAAFSIGYPIPARVSFSRGSVRGFRSAGEVAEAMGRGVKLDHGYRYIQADAAVDSGNIGGPLLDDSGKVLGMCALRRPGGPDGPDGFAIEWKAIEDLMAIAAKARAMDIGEIQKRAAAVKDEPSAFTETPTSRMDLTRAFNTTQRLAYCSRCGGKGTVPGTETRTRQVTKQVTNNGVSEMRTVSESYEVPIEKTCPVCNGDLVSENAKTAGEAIGRMAHALIWADLHDPAAVGPYWEGTRLLGEVAFFDYGHSSQMNQIAAGILSAPRKNTGNPVVFLCYVIDTQTIPNGSLLLTVLAGSNKCVVVECPGQVTVPLDQYCQIAGIVYGSDGSLPLVSAAGVEGVHKADPKYRAKHPAPLPPELAKMAARKLIAPPSSLADTREPDPAEQALVRARMYMQNNMSSKAIDILKGLLKNFPESKQAVTARQLLEELAPAEYPPKKK